MAGTYNYYTARPENAAPDGTYPPLNDYDSRSIRTENRYPPDRPLQRTPTSEYSYHPDDYRSRRSRAESIYDARTVYSEAPPQDRERRDRPSWLVTGLLTALVVATFAGFQVWQLRMQDGKGGFGNDRKDREDKSARSRRREEARQREDRRRDRKDNLSDNRANDAQVPQIEWTTIRRQRTRRTSRPPRRPEYLGFEDEYYDDEF